MPTKKQKALQILRQDIAKQQQWKDELLINFLEDFIVEKGLIDEYIDFLEARCPPVKKKPTAKRNRPDNCVCQPDPSTFGAGHYETCPAYEKE